VSNSANGESSMGASGGHHHHHQGSGMSEVCLIYVYIVDVSQERKMGLTFNLTLTFFTISRSKALQPLTVHDRLHERVKSHFDLRPLRLKRL
jgi:hypothetical protein